MRRRELLLQETWGAGASETLLFSQWRVRVCVCVVAASLAVSLNKAQLCRQFACPVRGGSHGPERLHPMLGPVIGRVSMERVSEKSHPADGCAGPSSSAS